MSGYFCPAPEASDSCTFGHFESAIHTELMLDNIFLNWT
jgi:hypothetical protein